MAQGLVKVCGLWKWWVIPHELFPLLCAPRMELSLNVLVVLIEFIIEWFAVVENAILCRLWPWSQNEW